MTPMAVYQDMMTQDITTQLPELIFRDSRVARMHAGSRKSVSMTLVTTRLGETPAEWRWVRSHSIPDGTYTVTRSARGRFGAELRTYRVVVSLDGFMVDVARLS